MRNTSNFMSNSKFWIRIKMGIEIYMK
jgi:hypothetical protein